LSRDNYPGRDRARGARQRILIASERRRRKAWPFTGIRSFAWRFHGVASRSVVNPGPIALLDNRLCDSVREHLAILRVARFAAFEAVAQETAFDQDRRISREPQHAKICRVHTEIGRASCRERGEERGGGGAVESTVA